MGSRGSGALGGIRGSRGDQDLGNTVGIPEDDTDLGGGEALLGQLEDLVLHLVGGDLQPLGHRPGVEVVVVMVEAMGKVIMEVIEVAVEVEKRQQTCGRGGQIG